MILRLSVFLCLCVAAPLAAQPTYSRQVSRIMQAKCQTCHRPNDIAPFALQSYDDASTWAEDIKRVVGEKIMPPWKPVDDLSKFRGARALTDEERQAILDWVDAGAPEGDPADLPEPLPDKGEWVLGEPDLVLQMSESYRPPRGKDMYRCFVLPTGLTENQFISAVDVLPGARGVVHHVLLYTDTTGEAEKLDAADDGPGYTCYGGPGTSQSVGKLDASNLSLSSLLSIGGTLGGWAPGQRPEPLPDGTSMFLDKNARIIMQVHYYSTRVTADDQTRLGLYFSKVPVEKRLLWVPIVPLDGNGHISMTIPAGAENHEVKAEFTTPPLFLFDVTINTIYPHMHLLGRKIDVQLQRPREDPGQMIRIEDWDFNWQGSYTYTEPVKAPAGSTVRLTCTYDNSVNNPKNPAPEPKTVTWGEGTEDEMCLAFLGITFDHENLLPFSAPTSKRRK